MRLTILNLFLLSLLIPISWGQTFPAPTSAPTGPASGVLNGSYPSPGFSASATLDLLASPVGSITWTFPATNTLTVTASQPGSQSGAGTSAGTVFGVTGVAGGATTGSATTAGNGSSILLTTGAGGDGSGGTNAKGGNGGAFNVNTGTSGAKSGSGVAGNLGTISLQQNSVSVFAASGAGATTVRAGVQTGALTIAGGLDTASAAVTYGPLVARGGNIASGATTGSIGGAATLNGGDNASTASSGTITGGTVTVRPGQVTAGGGATQTNGLLIEEQAFVKGGTYTANNAGYISAAPASGAGAGAATVSDCTSAAGNCQQFVGVNVAANGNAATLQTAGVVTVASSASAQWAASGYVCIDPTNVAKFITGGTVGCYGTRQAGFAVGDSGSVSTHPMIIVPGPPTTARAIVTSAQTGITTIADVTGLSFPVAASTNYTITCQLIYQTSASTASLQIAFTGPASPTQVGYSLTATATTSGTLAATIQSESTIAGFGTTLGDTLATTATTNMPATVTLGLVNGTTAGTVQLRAAGIGTGNVAIEPGSFCTMQ